MAKGDYPTGALVDVIRFYKNNGGKDDVYQVAKSELKHILVRLSELERDITAFVENSYGANKGLAQAELEKMGVRRNLTMPVKPTIEAGD